MTQIALSIRQPWAWLILNAGKNIENRTWSTKFRGRVLIHASQTMTKDDYFACTLFLAGIHLDLKPIPRMPAPDVLRSQCGGIVGEVEITDCVEFWPSPWFCGDYGFVLANPKPLPFHPCKGSLKFFKVDVT